MRYLSGRALQGDHALEIKATGGGAIGRIGEAFNYFTKELRRYRIKAGTPLRRVTDRKPE